jgi:arylsulfatase A-like enzyme
MSKGDKLHGISSYPLAAFAGILAGICAGIIEILIITRLGATPANFSGLLFAAVAYGIFGGLLGLILNLILQILPLHREKKQDRVLLGSTLFSAAFAAILFLIFLFRAFRDFHAERVRYLEPLGLLTIAILLFGAFLVFLLVRFFTTRIAPGFLHRLLRPVGFMFTTALIIIIGVILRHSFAGETEVVKAPFSADRQAEIQDKPNVLMIMLDAQRADRLGCYGGDEAAATPNMDALAKDGRLFLHAYSQASHTKPSTASLLTSRYPTEHHAIHKTEALPPGVVTLAEILGEAGYYCGGIVSNVNLAPVYNFQQGFHEYTYLPPKFLFGANEAASRLVIYGVLRLIRMKLVKSIYVDHFYRSGEVVTSYFDDFFRRNQDQRFFLFLHYMDPHDPYFEHPYNGHGYSRAVMPNPDPKYVQPFKDLYRQDVEYTDGWIGHVMDRLKSAGLYDKTLVVLTADHGEEFYEHQGWWHGTTLHEEQIHIPLIIKLPAVADSLHRDPHLARSVDVAPTILSAVGITPPEVMRGRDLFAPVSGDFVPEVFSEADHEGNVVQMLRVGSWKYIKTNPENPRHRPPVQLFNISDDPFEVKNLASERPELAADFEAQLQTLYADITAAREAGAEQTMDRATQERLRALGYTQ